jgi:hypothetical protein
MRLIRTSQRYCQAYELGLQDNAIAIRFPSWNSAILMNRLESSGNQLSITWELSTQYINRS